MHATCASRYRRRSVRGCRRANGARDEHERRTGSVRDGDRRRERRLRPLRAVERHVHGLRLGRGHHSSPSRARSRLGPICRAGDRPLRRGGARPRRSRRARRARTPVQPSRTGGVPRDHPWPPTPARRARRARPLYLPASRARPHRARLRRPRAALRTLEGRRRGTRVDCCASRARGPARDRIPRSRRGGSSSIASAHATALQANVHDRRRLLRGRAEVHEDTDDHEPDIPEQPHHDEHHRDPATDSCGNARCRPRDRGGARGASAARDRHRAGTRATG